MLNLQWDKDTALQARFDDGFDDGFEQGENQLAKLVALLLQNGKTDEVQIALHNPEKRNELYKLYQCVTLKKFFTCVLSEHHFFKILCYN